jgi:hypothetical protein
MRLLEIRCDFSDAYLMGHARRIGLADETTKPAELDRLLPTIRGDLRFESENLRDLNLPETHILREGAKPEENAAVLARFLGVPLDKARQIATTELLFAD